MPACNQISSVLGAALVLSATHPSDPMSPAGSLPPSATFIALPCRHILPSSAAAVDLTPSQVSPPLRLFWEQSARKVPLWLSWPPLIHPVSDLVPLLLLSFSSAASCSDTLKLVWSVPCISTNRKGPVWKIYLRFIIANNVNVNVCFFMSHLISHHISQSPIESGLLILISFSFLCITIRIFISFHVKSPWNVTHWAQFTLVKYPLQMPRHEKEWKHRKSNVCAIVLKFKFSNNNKMCLHSLILPEFWGDGYFYHIRLPKTNSRKTLQGAMCTASLFIRDNLTSYCWVIHTENNLQWWLCSHTKGTFMFPSLFSVSLSQTENNDFCRIKRRTR